MKTRIPKHTLRAPRRTTKTAPATEFIVPGLLLSAFRSVTRQPDASGKHIYTMREFREKLDCGEDRARQIMRALVASGWAKSVRKNVVSLSGVIQPVAAYELLDQQEVANG